MSQRSRPKIIAGNWKMHKTIEEACLFVETLAPSITSSQVMVYLAVPFTCLNAVAKKIEAMKLLIRVGAQNIHDAPEGAFTGEISAEMVKDAGGSFVIVGHSERRQLFHEDNNFVNRKATRALLTGLQPIVCIGETEEERQRGETHHILEKQLEYSLNGIDDLSDVILAYEPVWAIGTGRVAEPDDAREAHHFCRTIIARKWGKEQSERMVIQYGGSVNGDNAEVLLNQEGVDGLLVGGASLSADKFSKIINTRI